MRDSRIDKLIFDSTKKSINRIFYKFELEYWNNIKQNVINECTV